MVKNCRSVETDLPILSFLARDPVSICDKPHGSSADETLKLPVTISKQGAICRCDTIVGESGT
jgi:hypothetical protein